MKPNDLGLSVVPLSTPQRDPWHRLHAAASAHYRRGGKFAHHFARGKLKHDPVFRALLVDGAIPPRAPGPAR